MNRVNPLTSLLNSFRRANITLRQELGASAIEASKIAGHASVSQTGDYTILGC